jgi:hypothetical protein
MPPALTPALALDYVRELSADVRAVAIAIPGSPARLEAGPPGLAADVGALLAAAGTADELEVAVAGGVVCAVRRGERAAVAVCGPFAIPAVVREDLRAALAAVAGAPLDAAAPGTAAARASAVAADPADALATAAEALILAVQRGSEA